MIIASDIDGTLAQWHTAFAVHCQIDVTVFDRWEFWDAHMTRDEFLVKLRSFGESGRYMNLDAFPDGAHAVFGLVKAGHNVVAVTSREPTPYVCTSTYAWFATEELPVSAVMIGPQWKREVDADLLIDDDPVTVADVSEFGQAVPLLLDRPWNQDATGVLRVSWDEVPALVESLEDRVTGVPEGERRWVLGEVVAELVDG